MDFLSTRRRRRFLFAALYLSEGAPIGFIWWYLPTRLRAEGVAIESITALTALLVLPWTLKFLWAPLVDTLRTPRWPLRAWIIAAQTVMGLALLPLAWLDPLESFFLFVPLLLVHAVAAATQDVAIDALAIASTDAAERGSVNGWMQAGMLVGRSIFGGVSLIVAERLGEPVVVLSLAAVVWCSLVLVALSRERHAAPSHPGRGFAATLRAAIRQPNTWWGLLFALLGGAAFEAVGAVAGPFLIDAGHSQSAVGTFLALPAVGAMLAGALFGGMLADRGSRKRAAAAVLVATAAVVALLAGSAFIPAATWPILTVLYVCIGMFTAASYALFMDLTLPSLGATQFSAYMGATNACEAWSTFAVGRLAGLLGYPPAFALMAGASLIALPVLGRIRDVSAVDRSPDAVRGAGESVMSAARSPRETRPED